MKNKLCLALMFLSLAACSSNETKDSTASLPSPVIDQPAEAASDKMQYISEFKNKDKKYAEANVRSEGNKITVQILNPVLPKGRIGLLLIKGSCADLESKMVSLKQSQIDGVDIEMVSDLNPKEKTSAFGAEAKGAQSGKDYLSNRVFALYRMTSKQNTLVACEYRQ
jgi:hypothetical protein